ncbi:MAG: hypothetical protein J6T69_01975, partial [Methanobrevibacter sp.]|nr:hypothetical protein [Methanobrevibacter sp.]
DDKDDTKSIEELPKEDEAIDDIGSNEEEATLEVLEDEELEEAALEVLDDEEKEVLEEKVQN